MSRDVDPSLTFIDTTIERNLLFLEKKIDISFVYE